MRRRVFLAAATGLGSCSPPVIGPEPKPAPPSFLWGREGPYETNPRDTVLAWFRRAGRGLFLQYGVYSQLQQGPSIQFDDRIPPQQYRELGSTFNPEGFDADHITAVAVEGGFRYVGLSARHADGFCLFRTVETDFNSLESCGRDLVGELAAACEARQLGLVLSYSYAEDWRHPYFFPPEASGSEWKRSRPPYEAPQPRYKFEKDEDFLHYVRYANNQLQEIAYRYGQLAGIRLEPQAGYQARPDLFPVAQAYSFLRQARPGILISFGSGVTGDEDFVSLDSATAPLQDSGKRAEIACDVAIPHPGSRGNASQASARLASALRSASDRDANLLVRTELRPDGSLAPDSERVLRDLGRDRRT